jgi:cell wall-associated NlpC family hydrolase
LAEANRPSRVIKLVGGFVVAALIAGSGFFSTQTAMADPPTPTTVEEAQRQLDALDQETSKVEQDYNASLEKLDAAKQEKEDLQTQITEQQAKVNKMRGSVAAIVSAQQQNAAVSGTLGFLASATRGGDFLQQLATQASVTQLTGDQLARFASEQERLADMQKEMDSTLQAIEDETAKQKQLLDDAVAKEDKAQKILDRLTTAQRAALARTANSSSNTGQAAPAQIPTSTVPASERAATALAFAFAQVGKPYVMGGNGPNAFDCSGLTAAAYRQAGISLPRTSSAQMGVGRAISISELAPGDLVFFNGGGHVGIYVGNGMMVDAGTPRTGVAYRAMWTTPSAARRLA